MSKKIELNKTTDADVHIEQVNSVDIDEDLEKTAIFQFLLEEEMEKDKKKEQDIEEELSKTQQLFILNSRKESESLH